MRGGISSRARSYVRARATRHMWSTCVIERVAEAQWDLPTNLVTAGSRTVIYTGVCRVWEISSASVTQIADTELVQQSTRLSIPWDASPVPMVNDEVQIVESIVDTNLIGKRYLIMDEAKAGDLRATRRFVVKGIEERS